MDHAMKGRWYLGLVMAASSLCGGVGQALSADAPGKLVAGTANDLHTNAAALDVEAAWDHASAKEAESVTAHEITVAGRTIRFRATAGTLTIRDDNAKPIAR